jgi:hypothetical protein
MENTRPLDTSQFLNQEDISMISKLTQIKRDITTYFDMDLFINNMRKVIDESSYFTFRSETSRRFIEKNQPTFILKYSDEVRVILGNVNGVSEEVESKQVDQVTQLIAQDIIAKFSQFVTSCIKDSDKLNDLFTGLPTGTKEFFISNIYTIRVNVRENNIYILYFI